MKITEELLNEMKIKDENFSDGLIKPDGDYIRIPRGHLHGMMELLPWTENEIWKMIPDDDSPLFWLIEKTGCVLTDYNNSIGMKMTPAQQTVFDMMRKHGVLTDDYYDLTKQREKVREAREQKENRKQQLSVYEYMGEQRWKSMLIKVIRRRKIIYDIKKQHIRVMDHIMDHNLICFLTCLKKNEMLIIKTK